MLPAGLLSERGHKVLRAHGTSNARNLSGATGVQHNVIDATAARLPVFAPTVLPVATRRFVGRAERPDDRKAEQDVLSSEAVTRTSEETLTALYVAEYSRLLRLAALLIDDLGSCEEIVQDAYLKVHAALLGPKPRLRDEDRALAYLRQTVVNLARSSLRRRMVARKHAPRPMPDAPSAEEGAYAQVERAAVVQALRDLPRRQREAVVLRYYGDLTESAAAEVMGVSVGAVKAYTSRGLAALAEALEELR
jgi:RNA polymerase sigma-70 factor (sigma-E family)